MILDDPSNFCSSKEEFDEIQTTSQKISRILKNQLSVPIYYNTYVFGSIFVYSSFQNYSMLLSI